LNNPSFNLIFQLSPERKIADNHWRKGYPHTIERKVLKKGFGVFVNNIFRRSSSKLGAAARKEIAKVVGVD
jgi:hypothetical protein